MNLFIKIFILKKSLQDRNREDNQTPAQRQAAAKLALRKQLEKTLLQVKYTIRSLRNAFTGTIFFV